MFILPHHHLQISKIYIKQLLNPGVAIVQFLRWKAPQKGSTKPRGGAIVLNQTTDSTKCGEVLTVDVPPEVSGIDLTPLKRGSANRIRPIALGATAVGECAGSTPRGTVRFKLGLLVSTGSKVSSVLISRCNVTCPVEVLTVPGLSLLPHRRRPRHHHSPSWCGSRLRPVD